MSTSMFHHGFALKGMDYESRQYIEDSIVIRAQLM